MPIPSEKRGAEVVHSSSPAAHSHKSAGISRVAVQPIQKSSTDRQSQENAPFQPYEKDVPEIKAFSISTVGENSQSGVQGAKPFQLKANETGLRMTSDSNMKTIQLKEEMWIGSKKYAPGTFRQIEEDTNSTLNGDQRKIVTQWIEQEIEFKDAAEFRAELAILLKNWEKQKVFYKNNDTTVTAAQEANSTVRMFSSRNLDAIDKLYLWAVANDLQTEGFGSYMTTRTAQISSIATAPVAPFKGHLADRAHTIKHWHQKKTAGTGVGLISIDLKAAGVTAVQEARNGQKITGGGEGTKVGKIGFKAESNFYSAAMGETNATWDVLKPYVKQITLHNWEAPPAPPVVPPPVAVPPVAPPQPQP